jgi:hypothetical protein
MGRPRAGKQGKGQRERTARVLAERQRIASEMARSPTRTVTLRIPAALNEWLDAYRHLSYPDRVGKQELVVEGLVMAYLRRGRPREPVLRVGEVFGRHPPVDRPKG